ncbi:MAG: hypothetical protein WKF89_11235 [Chitinophagaceae bacterium]
MKNCIILFKSALLLALLPACDNAGKDAKQDAENLGLYVDSVNKVTPEYTNAYWASIDSGYQARLSALQLNESELNEAEKKKVEESKEQYETMKVAYTAKIKEVSDKETAVKETANDYRQVLRNSLFGEGKMGSDMQFNYVNADNALSVYDNFVNTVADQKNKYTREDWDEIKVLYEALDTRKNEIEKDLDGKDNRKIAGLKIRFASIKALERGGSKGTENKKAKQ